MKIKIVLILLLLGIGHHAIAGNYKTIEMTETKVTQLIFSSKILSFKGGFLPSDFVITTENNVLYIQPVVYFEESNINILTEDGAFYSFIISYNQTARTYNYVFTPEDAIYINNTDDFINNIRQPVIQGSQNMRLAEASKKILSKNGYLVSGNVSRTGKLYMILKGVYTDADNLYIRMEFENKGNIKYDLDYIAYTIHIVEKSKKTTDEMLQMFPIYTHNLPEIISAKSTIEVVACFPKFTIGEQKRLSIRVLEKNGERNIEYNLGEDLIIKAKNYE